MRFASTFFFSVLAGVSDKPHIHLPSAGTVHRSGDAVTAQAYVPTTLEARTRFVIRPDPNPSGLPPIILRSNVGQSLHLPVGCFALSLEDARESEGETPPYSAPPGLIDSVNFCVRALKVASSPYYTHVGDLKSNPNGRSRCEATALLVDGLLRELLRHALIGDLSNTPAGFRVERLLSRLRAPGVVGTGCGCSCTPADPRADTSFRLSLDPHLWNRITHQCTSEQLVPQSSSVYSEVGQAIYPVCMESLLQARFGAACRAALCRAELCRAAHLSPPCSHGRDASSCPSVCCSKWRSKKILRVSVSMAALAAVYAPHRMRLSVAWLLPRL